MNTPGRNDPCWCGSGKKYKKCHAGADDSRRSVGAQAVRERSSLPVLGPEELEGMRAACTFNAGLLDHVRPHVKAGITTAEIDRIVHEYTLDHGHTPATLGYRGFPRSCCTSINEVVCHGIPDSTALRDGDIINVDLTTIVEGWHGDQSETFLIGEVSDVARHVTQVAFDCLHAGIDAIRPYGSVRAIGEAICRHAHAEQLAVVREYQGHGLGRKFHQPPDVPHYPDTRIRYDQIVPGVCFTIEPMINTGSWRTALDRGDGWTVRTVDGELSAQFEHTLVMTEEGPEILTLTKDGPQKGHRF